MLDTLLDALPHFARAADGYALLADASGTIVRAVDSRGGRLHDREGRPLPGFEPGGGGPRRLPCPVDGERSIWAIPLNGNYLCVSDRDAGPDPERRMREIFEEALPLIARVAGGEAVLFDREGTRLKSVDSTGKSNPAYVGKTSALARQSMVAGKPVLGDSTYIVGAKAVRIPVGDSFGIGFNNNDSVAQRQKLIDSIYELSNAETVFADIVDAAPESLRMKREAMEAAPGDGTVLLLGAKGVGKRMLAQAMHNGGPRRGRPFVTVNCDAMEQDLLEGALFGYADAVIRGVMRGRHPGAIVLADGGTLYLANIDKLAPVMQDKLCQAMAGGRFRPVGDNEAVGMNVRVIASTVHPLEPLVKVGRFDEELCQLLGRRVIALPPLAQTRENIPGIINAFVKQLNLQHGKRVEGVDDEVMGILASHAWRGNAGELRAFLQTVYAGIEQAAVIKKHHLPMGLLKGADALGGGDEPATVYDMLVAEYEAQIIRHALLVNDGSRLRTAEHLGLSKSSLWRKMKKLNIE